MRCWPVLVIYFFLAFAELPANESQDWLAGDPFLQMLVGEKSCCDPVVQKLVTHPIMERLRHVGQLGMVHYTNGVPAYSRYVHSVGAYLLACHFGASRREQIAALLHDASHTAFSHIGDIVYRSGDGQFSYQDEIHTWCLQKWDLEAVLREAELVIADLHPSRPEFTCLEQPLPDLCIDRLEYNLHTAVLFDWLTVGEAAEILAAIRFEGGRFFMTDIAKARRLGTISLFLTQNLYTSPWDRAVYYWAAEAIKACLSERELSHETMHFGTDAEVLKVLAHSEIPRVRTLWQKMHEPRDHFCLKETKGDLHERLKFRGIDPLVKTAHGLERLTTLDPFFSEMYTHVSDLCERGWHLCWKEPADTLVAQSVP